MAVRLRRALTGVLAVVVLGSAGCGAGGGEADAAAPPTTGTGVSTTEPTTTTTTPPAEEEAVLAAYQGYWDTWLVANDPPNPDHPDLAKYATGVALETVRASISEHRDLGQVVRLPENSRYSSDARLESLIVDEATVHDCAPDDSMVVDLATGIILDDTTGTFEFEAKLRSINGRWLVAWMDQKAFHEGIVPCEL